MHSLRFQCSTLSLLIYFVLESRSVDSNKTETSPSNKKLSPRKCLPSEVLTLHKGCVDRETFLDQVLVRTWADENLDKVKKGVGVEQVAVTCKPNEIMTAYGCATQKKPLRHDDSKRASIVHSRLLGNRVIKGGSGYGYADVYDAADTKADSGRTHIKRERNKHSGGGPPVQGHNRPRHSVYMPGRKLRSGRRCRPYEVRAKHNRCIRKRGKKGQYTHHDHSYGLQKRHRHHGAEGEDGKKMDGDAIFRMLSQPSQT